MALPGNERPARRGQSPVGDAGNGGHGGLAARKGQGEKDAREGELKHPRVLPTDESAIGMDISQLPPIRSVLPSRGQGGTAATCCGNARLLKQSQAL